MTEQRERMREIIYLDEERVRSVSEQAGIAGGAGIEGSRERTLAELEAKLLERGALRVDEGFDFGTWTPEAFHDGRFVIARGTVRLLDYQFLSRALAGLPAVLRKMSKMEMEALRNSEQGRRMSKQQLQSRSQENQVAITKVEEFKFDELGSVVQEQYGDLVRVKVRPSEKEPAAILVGSAYSRYFSDTPSAMSQKYGVEINAGWTVIGQLNVSNVQSTPTPMPVGNQMEDGFEQIALLMNNAFRVANGPAWPALSMTVLAIHRSIG
ncbi:MAG TPA: hypothetical protein VF669_20540 [Tepidisphaeraceae bacterium]|jgi:hypothetical protein